MNIGFIGDVHLNANRRHSQYNGINVYKTVFGALDQAVDLIDSTDIYFTGDIFDNCAHYDQEVLNFTDWIKAHPNHNFYTITGNHDTSKKKFWKKEYDPYNVLYIVQKACKNFHIIDISQNAYSPHGIYEDEKVRVFGLPYFEYESEFKFALKEVATKSKELRDKGWKTLLLTHQNLVGHVRLSTIKATDPLFKEFDYVINGHLHRPQWEINNHFLLQGSLITSTKSDEWHRKRNVSVLNLDTFKLKRKELQGLPEFRYYKHGETLKDADKSNFIIWEAEEAIQKAVKSTSTSFDKLPYKDILDRYIKSNGVDKDLLKNLDLSPLDKDVDNAHIKLVFNEIELEGFGSYVNPATYRLDMDGITWIRGLPGSGKSTIFKALNWTLEGRYYNKENAFADPTSKDDWAKLSATGFRGCRTQLSFLRNDIEHLLIRHRGFKGESMGKKGKNYVHLYKKVGDEFEYINLDEMYPHDFDDIHAALSRNNSKILKYLGLSANMIKYTMVVSPEYFDLISMKQSDVREVFYSLIDLGWVDALDTQLYMKTKDTEAELDALTHKKTVEETRLKGVDDRIKDQNENYTEGIASYNKQNNDLTDKESDLTDKKRKYKKIISEQNKVLKTFDMDQMSWYSNIYANSKQRVEWIEKQLVKLDAKAQTIKAAQEFNRSIKEPDAEAFQNTQQVYSNAVSVLNQTQKITKKEINEAENKLNTLTNTKVYDEKALKALNISLKDVLEDLDNDFSKCPTCGQGIKDDTDYSNHIQEYVDSLTTKKDNIEAKIKTLTEKLADEDRIESIRTEITQLQIKAVEITQIRSDKDTAYSQATDAHQKALTTYSQAQREIHKNAREFSSILEEKSEAVVELNSLRNTKVNIEEIKAKYSEYKSCQGKMSSAKTFLDKTLSSLEVISEQISLLRKTKPTKAKVNDLTKQRSVLNKKVKSMQKEVDSLTNLLTELKALKRTVFHARGLKPFAISFYLDYLNAACSAYADLAGIKLNIQLNESSNFEFKVSINNTELDGRELSKGWTTFSNLVLLGGLTQMREINVMSNILAVDEPFSTVPEESTSTIMNLIRTMSGNKALHVIAHSNMLEASNATFVDVTGGIESVESIAANGKTRLINVPAVSTFQ